MTLSMVAGKHAAGPVNAVLAAVAVWQCTAWAVLADESVHHLLRARSPAFNAYREGVGTIESARRCDRPRAEADASPTAPCAGVQGAQRAPDRLPEALGERGEAGDVRDGARQHDRRGQAAVQVPLRVLRGGFRAGLVPRACWVSSAMPLTGSSWCCMRSSLFRARRSARSICHVRLAECVPADKL